VCSEARIATDRRVVFWRRVQAARPPSKPCKATRPPPGPALARGPSGERDGTSAQAKEPGQVLAVDGGEPRQLDATSPRRPPAEVVVTRHTAPRPRQSRRLPRRNAGAYRQHPSAGKAPGEPTARAAGVPAPGITGRARAGLLGGNGGKEPCGDAIMEIGEGRPCLTGRRLPGVSDSLAMV
jgi:hypothetical protein